MSIAYCLIYSCDECVVTMYLSHGCDGSRAKDAAEREGWVIGRMRRDKPVDLCPTCAIKGTN